jgi:hypothetical protein
MLVMPVRACLRWVVQGGKRLFTNCVDVLRWIVQGGKRLWTRSKWLSSTPGRIVGFLSLVAMLLFYWGSYVQTLPLVTPQTTESSSSVLHFKIEDPVLFSTYAM